ncbi:MAG: hypothetical protein M1821_000482 [Bathelium mastoideum]|nr:MAG: hypothetical protein M1821_000482 [Bathelium mastoideum]
MTKYYCLAPTRDSPPNGPIALGNIIASWSTPEEALNSTDSTAQSPPLPQIYESIQTNWKSEREKHRAGSGGVWASFLQFVGIGGDFGLSSSKSDKDIYEFERLVTRYLVPSSKYIEEALSHPDVQDFLQRTKSRDPLYMITGIKLAIGATFAREKMRERGINAQFGIDLTAAGMGTTPIQVGPKVDLSRGSSDTESSSALSDFVFAYRLRRIRFKKGIVVHEDYTKHALYSNTESLFEDEEGAEIVPEGLFNEEDTAKGFGSKQEIEAIDDEDGEACKVIVPEDD